MRARLRSCSAFRVSQRTLGCVRATRCGAGRHQAAHKGRAAHVHGGTASREWPATDGLHAMWPHLINMMPLLGSFSDLKERMHGPNISTTPIVEASYLMSAPSPKSLNTASRAVSSARLLKDRD